ncbi:MAG: DUF3089 domain-containing protein [Paludibacteraceae bacterium]|jgi:hypothetical protein|nr:DUF3089 domain-containing protein [Paludibacteraceae bacterium]
MKRKVLLFCVLAILLINCAPKDTSTDYSQSSNWVVNAQGCTDKGIDVFFMMPTCWRPIEGDGTYCDIDNATLIEGAAKVLNEQTSVFGESCNIYMPYYRQLNIQVATELSTEEAFEKLEAVPYQDIVGAFKYYLEHYNNGKPFILASHSQGTQVGIIMFRNFLNQNPEVQARMIAAYLIGFTVNKSDTLTYTNMHEAKSATDLGTIISWNAEAPNLKEKSFICTGNGMCINPINWKTDSTYASASEGKGSRVKEGNEYVDKFHFADAQINLSRGSVQVSTIPQDYWSGLPYFPKGVFHGLDYALFYYDIRQNVKDRIEAYLAQ